MSFDESRELAAVDAAFAREFDLSRYELVEPAEDVLDAADWHSDHIKFCADRKSEARRQYKALDKALIAEKRRLTDNYQAAMRRLARMREDGKAVATEISENMDRLIASSRAALRVIEQ